MKPNKYLASIIYSFLILWAIGVFSWGYVSFDDQTIRSIKLTQIYGLSAITCLFVSHFIFGISGINNKFKSKYFVLLRPFVFLTFLFALLHAFHAFFFNLGGFEGLSFLSQKYLIAIALGDITLVALFLFSLTFINYALKKFRILDTIIVQVLFYLGGISILIHVLMLGSHFAILSDFVPRIFYVLFVVLLFIESVRLDNFLRPRMRVYPSFGFILPVFLVLGGYFGFYVFGGSAQDGNTSLGIHAQHIKIAQEASMGASGIIGSKGDPTKRFRVDINQNIKGLDGKFEFIVYDASNGSPAILFEDMYEKKMHLIIVDSTLEYYDHIHPEYVGEGRFVINTKFPQNGRYYMYTDFQPIGAIEQQYGFQIDVGEDEPIKLAEQRVDTNLSKSFGEYEVTLSGEKKWIASAMSLGQQRMIFTFKENGEDVNNLKPYLGAFGHLVMINQKTYQYIHVHPMGLPPVAPDEERGPSVEFSPIGLYGPIPKGVYRVFGQFNPNDKLMTVDFTIEVK